MLLHQGLAWHGNSAAFHFFLFSSFIQSPLVKLNYGFGHKGARNLAHWRLALILLIRQLLALFLPDLVDLGSHNCFVANSSAVGFIGDIVCQFNHTGIGLADPALLVIIGEAIGKQGSFSPICESFTFGSDGDGAIGQSSSREASSLDVFEGIRHLFLKLLALRGNL